MPKGQYGDMQSWTGSIVDHEGKYYFYYTARSADTNGRQQRIFLATSDDLMTWEPYAGNPVINARAEAEYPMEPDEFALLSLQCAKNGATLLGGCCGTDPEFIAAVNHVLTESEGR